MATTKAQGDFIYNVAESCQMMMLDAQRRMKNALYDYIEVLQEGIGYVPFDEDYCPTFTDSTTEETQHIFGVRIIKDVDNFRTLQIYTDDFPYDKMSAPLSGWFNPYIYGEFDEGELLNYLKELDDKNNE